MNIEVTCTFSPSNHSFICNPQTLYDSERAHRALFEDGRDYLYFMNLISWNRKLKREGQ